MRCAFLQNILIRQTVQACLLGCFIIGAQLIATAHASEHLFHAADSHCIVLSSAEKHSPIIRSSGLIQVDDRLFQLAQPLARAHAPLVTVVVYLTRAPPASRFL